MPIACPDSDLELLQADARTGAWLVLLTPLPFAQRASLLEKAAAGGRPVLLIDPQLEAEAPWWLNWKGWRGVIFPGRGGAGGAHDEFLNTELFTTAPEVQIQADRWRWEYNSIRPHATL